MTQLQIRLGEQQRDFHQYVSVHDALQAFGIAPELPVIGALHNNYIKGLNAGISTSGDLQPVRLDSSQGHRIYRKSLCFLMNLAAHRIFGKDIPRISHSLGDGYFFYPPEGSPLPMEKIAELKQEMHRLVEADLPITPRVVSYAEALDIFDTPGREETHLLVQQRNQRKVNCQECDGFYDLDHFPLASRTGVLSVWDLVPYEHGLVLQFPPKGLPLRLQKLQDKPLLFGVFNEYNRWGRILGIPNLPHLNKLAGTREIAHFIAVAEALHDRKLSGIADQIAARREEVKVVLIAGPSSAGKTTFSKKLAIHLEVVGFRPRVIGLDNYFVPREQTPLDEHGQYDFEALGALDIELLNQHLLALAAGDEVAIPVFDFKIGNRKPEGTRLRLEPNDILIMEGIHGLNPDLVPRIPRSQTFRIYISALTQLNLDSHNRISTTDNRLIRRMVRDSQFRGYTAEHTLQRWPSVRRGEDRNIFPFQETADTFFNSALDYELSVLRTYALPMLRTVSPQSPEFASAAILTEFLENFHPILPEKVPRLSILREFIGGSGFSY
ncbi:nucleoside kinase [Spirochaeta africana]|uniref:Uridine kinase n=1 Tax=Spirochaeta africana (strain ATCC 700263 / DSM 8902 / Z-7692) TaxID=889378 RepID=H9UL27_SPIAZ|nr:nucleoside kinase [Spirochaeta africana]AFG38220.1 uridine kinase [Spirochaeta africana DSM 8902]